MGLTVGPTLPVRPETGAQRGQEEEAGVHAERPRLRAGCRVNTGHGHFCSQLPGHGLPSRLPSQSGLFLSLFLGYFELLRLSLTVQCVIVKTTDIASLVKGRPLSSLKAALQLKPSGFCYQLNLWLPGLLVIPAHSPHPS